MDIKSLPAGPELDREYAQLIGYVSLTTAVQWDGSIGVIPRYSTTWEGAGVVIEEMQRRGFNVLIGNHAVTGKWVVEIGSALVEDMEGCPHAITIAAILALRSEAAHG